MRFAAVADVHGNLAALEAVLADCARLGVGRIVNLGDCLSGPLDAAGTAERLMTLGLPTVRGNHDRWLGEETPATRWEAHLADVLPREVRRWCADLPPVLEWEGVFLCHATPGDDLSYWLHRVTEAGARPATLEEAEAPAAGIGAGLILCGHTHLAAAVRLGDGRLVVNPGSVGCPAFAGDHPFPHVMEAGTPHARYAILDDAAGAWEATFRLVAYDAAPMVAMARAAGAAGWVRALTEGRA